MVCLVIAVKGEDWGRGAAGRENLCNNLNYVCYAIGLLTPKVKLILTHVTSLMCAVAGWSTCEFARWQVALCVPNEVSHSKHKKIRLQ